jgi:hypothetical protein
MVDQPVLPVIPPYEPSPRHLTSPVLTKAPASHQRSGPHRLTAQAQEKGAARIAPDSPLPSC